MQQGGNMNTLVVYDSQYGNTERIARIIAHTLRAFGEAHAVRVDPYHIFKTEGLDLLILWYIKTFTSIFQS